MAGNKSIQFRGKKSVLKQFESLKMPVWRLYNIDEQKSPFAKYEGKILAAANKELSEVLDNIEPTGIYMIDAFYPINTKEEKNYHLPDAQMIFTLEEKRRVEIGKDKEDVQQRVSVYSPEFEDHIKLIKQNAELKAERDYYAKCYNESVEEVARLEQEIKIKDEELDSIEEDADISGTPEAEKLSFQDVITGLLHKHGDKLVDSLVSKKLRDTSYTPNPAVQMNGTNENLLKIIEELRKHDANIERHLFLLLQLAVQDTDLFNGMLGQLEKLFEKKPAE